ncbi:DUF5009 domain-containing protein [Danxiaibacter flavus]|uniref:DUF5009 domain-containing protein n=1 Tax=Danxiaibacter flavus TaxID=3049108 RepID=A0ABV3ZAY7_9BACT|nr:DUF5009 domain-containing protein [Chitinophagaceae bacterium DXS]
MTIHLPTNRVAAIDVTRALTMLLMIFVNDLWSLRDIPGWLEHVAAKDDGMGLADTVFPAFLFIVGLSIPFAIAARIKKGDDNPHIVKHILSRSLALLVMGVFLVNGEEINEAATGMPRVVWNIICCTCFIVLWNVYPKSANKRMINVGKSVALVLLVVLAIFYRGGKAPDVHYFSTSWWGILGLIGWSYLVGSLACFIAREKIIITVIFWLLFLGLCIARHAHVLPQNLVLHAIVGPLGEGGLAALVLGGVITGQIFRYFMSGQQWQKMLLTYLVLAILLLVAGFGVRPLDGISKIRATPSWVLICSSITLFLFIVVFLVADVWGKASLFNPIKPAGTDTLLCYLMPYYAYAIVVLFNLGLPGPLLVGAVGLLKSFFFSLIMIWCAGGLNRIGIKLKL